MMNAERSNVSADERLLSVADIATMTGLGQRTVRRWLTTGQIPLPDYRLGGKHLRWRRGTIDRWLAEQAAPGDPNASPRERLAALERWKRAKAKAS